MGEGRPQPSALSDQLSGKPIKKVATTRQPGRDVTTQNRTGRMAVTPRPTLDVPNLPR